MAVAALSGLSPAGAEGPDKPEITGRGTAFSPTPLEVSKGTEVTWRIAEGETQAHNVVLDDPKADCSGDSDCDKKNNSPEALGAGSTFVRKFEKPGEYRYHCVYHGGTGGQGMSGIVRVIDPSAPPPTTPTTAAAPPPTTPTTAAAPPTTATTAAPPPTSATTKPPVPKVEPTPTTKPTQASAAGKAKPPKPPKPATTTGPSTTTTKAPETTTTVATVPFDPLGNLPALVQAPSETTSTTRPGSGDGFEAINARSPRGGAKKLTMAAVGTLGLSLMAGGFVWWRRRPSRYWSA